MLKKTWPPLAALALACVLGAGCASAPKSPRTDWPAYTLQADRVTVLNPPGGGRVDTSALLALRPGELLTVNNLRPQCFRIDTTSAAAEAPLVPAPEYFSAAQLAAILAPRERPYDLEGLARDDAGRFYACDEAQRWILRLDTPGPASHAELLPIDWSPVASFFSTADRNASFEGIAVGGPRLYLANERSAPLILTVNLQSLKVTDWFQPRPRKGSFLGTHYSDLCWFEGRLWVLCRQHRVVLETDPATHEILAEFDYEAVEDALGYRKTLPVGLMEGLAVEPDAIWLLTDNNGYARPGSPRDLRPTLVRCPRPDRKR